MAETNDLPRVSAWVHPVQARLIRTLPDFEEKGGSDKKIGEYHGIDIHETTIAPATPSGLADLHKQLGLPGCGVQNEEK